MERSLMEDQQFHQDSSSGNYQYDETFVRYIASLPEESQICAQVLHQLATGTTPKISNMPVPKIPKTPKVPVNDNTRTDAANTRSTDISSPTKKKKKDKNTIWKKGNQTSATITSNKMHIINATSTAKESPTSNPTLSPSEFPTQAPITSASNDAMHYSTQTHHQNLIHLNTALSILLDSTSPGPDPLAMKNLGWAYSGGGGGGGMGDWDGCHYMPGNIGGVLRVMQDSVAEMNAREHGHDSDNENDEMDYKEWWMQEHDVEYGTGTERAATRFCTVGGIGPYTQPYDTDGFEWSPPIAGICVPSACTAKGLYSLFIEIDGFPDLLLDLSSKQGFYDEIIPVPGKNDGGGSGGMPPTASRRFRYMNSLTQSLAAGKMSHMGVVCEGESGMRALDEEGFVSDGCLATLGLVCVLFVFVLIGTISASLLGSNGTNGEGKTGDSKGGTLTFHGRDNVEQNHIGNGNYDASASVGAGTGPKKKQQYGSVSIPSEENGLRMRKPGTELQDEFQFTLTSESCENRKGNGAHYNEFGSTYLWDGKEPIPTDPSTSINQIAYSQQVSSLQPPLSPTITNIGSSSTHAQTFLSPTEFHGSPSPKKNSKDDNSTGTYGYQHIINTQESSPLNMDHQLQSLLPTEGTEEYDSNDERTYSSTCTHTLLKQIKSTFADFEAAQSFYEITRLKREHPFGNKPHERKLHKTGESSLDPYNSHHGLFPMWNYSEFRELKKRSNGNNIVSTAPSSSFSSSKCLNGMRSISMLWIIFGHTMAVQSSIGYVNPAAVLPPTGMMSSTLGTLFLSARYAVDTFFFIGGYLVMSSILKRLDPKLQAGYSPTTEEKVKVDRWKSVLTKLGIVSYEHVVNGEYGNRLQAQVDPDRNQREKRPKGLSWVLPFLLHRIFRILPTYGFVLLLWWKVGVYMGDGPFWPRWATFTAQCDAQWWTNMLFINNIVPKIQPFGETSECMYHAWYLGVDFQLCATLTPIFVSLFLKRGCRRLTIATELILIVAIICTSYHFSYKYDWSANLFDGADTVSFDRGFYINPFFRSSPYIFGFITAQMWHEKSRQWPNMGFTKIASVILSFCSVSLLLFLTLGMPGCNKRPCLIWESPHTSECGSGWSRDKLALVNSLVRPAWGLGLALMSFLSFNGQLCCLCSSSVLNWAGWDPIGRLSFSMYLLHPLIINIWVLGGASKFRYSHLSFIYAFAGIVTVTFVTAVVVGMLVEWPLSKITRRMEKRLWG